MRNAVAVLLRRAEINVGLPLLLVNRFNSWCRPQISSSSGTFPLSNTKCTAEPKGIFVSNILILTNNQPRSMTSLMLLLKYLKKMTSLTISCNFLQDVMWSRAMSYSRMIFSGCFPLEARWWFSNSAGFQKNYQRAPLLFPTSDIILMVVQLRTLPFVWCDV